MSAPLAMMAWQLPSPVMIIGSGVAADTSPQAGATILVDNDVGRVLNPEERCRGGTAWIVMFANG